MAWIWLFGQAPAHRWLYKCRAPLMFPALQALNSGPRPAIEHLVEVYAVAFSEFAVRTGSRPPYISM
jgi:hypothetical protein